jgi:hypothetical protein
MGGGLLNVRILDRDDRFQIEIDATSIDCTQRLVDSSRDLLHRLHFSRLVNIYESADDRACVSRRRLLMTPDDPTSSRYRHDNFLSTRSCRFAFTRARDKKITRQSNYKLFLRADT